MINRVEIIDWTKKAKFGGGRVFIGWEDDIKIDQDIQDNGRTLKIFIQDKTAKKLKSR